MPCIPYATTGQLRETLGRSPFPDDTHPGGVFRMLAHTPALGAAALTLIYSALNDSGLDPPLREIVILRVAQRSRATYAFSQHSAIARSVGVVATQISSLGQGAVPEELFDDRQRAAVAFVDESLDAPEVGEPTWCRVRVHFSPRQIVELLLTAGCFRMMSRLVSVVKLDMEPSFGVDTLRRAQDASKKGSPGRGWRGDRLPLGGRDRP